ncbi:MAG: sigma-54-dependent Fis family transcriptional regulator [bacterium]|nr:sigma-54-dependent Fis family transcriptional regulator [bacterium]
MGAPSLDVEALQGLHNLARELLQLDDYDKMVDTVVKHSLETLRGERGFLVLQRGDELDFKVVRNWSRRELEGKGEPVSRSIVSRVLADGEPVLVEDALSDQRFAQTESILRMQIRSVLAAPLEVDGVPSGVLYLESRTLDRLFGPAQLELFKHILELSSPALESCMKRIVLEQRNRLLEANFLERHRFPGIVTQDPGFLKVLETVAQVAKSDLPVLVQGPSGTGKELVVRALHLNSPRAKAPYVTVNCGAISPHLLESELFGHVRGSFTGATRDKLGVISSADRGSVFLDEVGELPPELQVKLLRTLQFGEVQPVGSSRPATVDVRFLAATNRNLEQAVAKGEFREDLLYRLNVVTLDLPPLCERPDDILPLFYHFLHLAAEKAGRPDPQVSPRLERVLEEHVWPGNIRELENEAKRLVAVTPQDEPLTVDRLSQRIIRSEEIARPTPASLAEHEKELIELHLRLAKGNRTHAAQSLGISREGLRKKMKRLGLA